MKNTTARVASVAALVTAVVVGFAVLVGYGTSASAAGPTSVTIGTQTHAINGQNVYRSSNFLVQYTPAKGARTGTNQYGYEAAVVNGVVTAVQNGVGNMVIPSNGYVLSGHGTSKTWLAANAKVGATVVLDAPPPTTTAPPTTEPPTTAPPTTAPPTTAPPTGTQLLPDVGVRTLRQFSIVNAGGKKLLKFPGVTANIGRGPLEVKGTRSSSTSTDWKATQIIYTSTGGKVEVPSNIDFYFAGDGHTHWHMRDFDGYELFDPSGHKLRDGEKHGFCFEDNTGYRDWPSKHTNGAPGSPVYTHAASCGQGEPNATSITHGLSVGWGDTYPTTLPDQGIDVTGLADGNYRVILTADQFGGIKESNESNNSASALIKITGNTVALLSASDGL
jgi:hypothetical protein